MEINMKKIILAALMTICVAASAVAQEVHPYIGFFPISYEKTTYTVESEDSDESYLIVGLSPLYVGVKVSDFRVDFMIVNETYILQGMNFYYDINVNENLLPYLQLGIAYFRGVKDTMGDIGGGNWFPCERTQTVTVFTLGAGIGYKVVNNFILDAGVGFNLSKEKEKNNFKDYSYTTTGKETSKGFGVKLGARYQF